MVMSSPERKEEMAIDPALEKRLRRIEGNLNLVYKMVKEFMRTRMPKEMMADFEKESEEINKEESGG